MIKKTGLLAGLALGCVLTNSAAFAEEYRGFYFGVWGGSGDMEYRSKANADAFFSRRLAIELPLVPIRPGTNLAATPLTSTLDDSLTPWGAQVGYRFNKWVAAELGYVDLGELLYTLSGSISGPYRYIDDKGQDVTRQLNGNFQRSQQITSTGVTGSVLGMLPLGPHFDLHVRGGIYYADTRVTDRLRYIDGGSQGDVFNLLHRRVDASQTELFGGLGAAWNINQSFALRVEYQRFFDVGDDEKNGEGDVDVINLSVLFK